MTVIWCQQRDLRAQGHQIRTESLDRGGDPVDSREVDVREHEDTHAAEDTARVLQLHGKFQLDDDALRKLTIAAQPASTITLTSTHAGIASPKKDQSIF